MRFTHALLPVILSSSALTSPTAIFDKRAETFCGQWDLVETGTYTLYNNLWGRDAATSGEQCTTLTSNVDDILTWSTAWSWAGGPYNVKSFANAVLKTTTKTVSAISSIPLTWTWSYTGDDIVANVACDIFTSSTPTGSEEYEIMIWLGALGGAGPISSTGSPIATVTIAGVSWKLWNGPNGNMNVYSFVADSQVTNFSGDLMGFLDYLEASWSFPTSQYVKSIGSGTEPFLGSNAVFTTSAYKITVN